MARAALGHTNVADPTQQKSIAPQQEPGFRNRRCSQCVVRGFSNTVLPWRGSSAADLDGLAC